MLPIVHHTTNPTNSKNKLLTNMSQDIQNSVTDLSVIRKDKLTEGDYRIEYARSDRAKCRLTDSGIA